MFLIPAAAVMACHKPAPHEAGVPSGGSLTASENASGEARAIRKGDSPLGFVRRIDQPPVTLKEGDGRILFSVHLQDGYGFTPETVFELRSRSQPQGLIEISDPSGAYWDKMVFPVEIPYRVNRGEGILSFETTVYYCTQDHRRCFVDSVLVEMPFSAGVKGDTHPVVAFEVLNRPFSAANETGQSSGVVSEHS